MTDILIERCRVQVVRRGGWSWGADRSGLVERATRALPELIANRIAELAGETDDDVEITEPIRIRIGMRQASLFNRSALESAVQRDVTPEDLGHLRLACSNASQGVTAAPEGGSRALAEPDPALEQPESLRPLQRLLQWREEKRLWDRIGCFSNEALDTWLRSVVADLPGARMSDERLAAAGEIVTRFAQAIEKAPRTPRPKATRLYLSLELVARFPDEVAGADLEALLDLVEATRSEARRRGTPSDGATDASVRPSHATQDAVAEVADTRLPQRTPPLPTDAAKHFGKVALCSVLPYLVLGELQRIGYLDVLATALQAAHLADKAAAFARLLALKLLPAPERGWRYSPEVQRTAAAFAGEAAWTDIPPLTPIDASALCSPPNAFLAAELGQGHDPNLPLLLARVDGGTWLLLDADGAFPACVTTELVELLNALERFRGGVVLVPEGAATKELMQGLSDADKAFVTDARPGRGEHWQPLASEPGYWTNTPDNGQRMLQAVHQRGFLEQAVAALWTELGARRPVPGTAPPLLDHGLLIGAAAGLGMLAWRLWREREQTTPTLALERFIDLEGSARFSETEVQVRMSVGRRYLDLRDQGALRDMVGVPWLGGRTLRFIGP